MRKVFALALGLLTLVPALSARADTEITTCGQEIQSGAAYLSADLDCTGSPVSYGIRFYGNGVVDLRGFTIRNASNAIVCDGNCYVRNGSMIDNLSNVGGKRVKLANVTIGRDVRGSNYGVIGEKGANLKNVTIDIGGDGVVGNRGTIKLDTVTITTAENAVRTDGTIVAVRSTISGVSRAGLMGTRVKLIDSSVTGSGTDPDCNTVTGFTFFLCGDVVSWDKPTVRKSTCDTSVVDSSNLMLPDPADWNVCTLD